MGGLTTPCVDARLSFNIAFPLSPPLLLLVVVFPIGRFLFIPPVSRVVKSPPDCFDCDEKTARDCDNPELFFSSSAPPPLNASLRVTRLCGRNEELD